MATAPLLGSLASAWRARAGGQCLVCRTWQHAAVCTPCRDRYGAPLARCARCGLALSAPDGRCTACLAAPLPLARTVVAFDHAFPWDALVARLKFQGDVAIAAVLAQPLVEAVRAVHGPQPAVDLVVATPLSRTRLAERGYNQAWEIARRAARELGLPAHARVLERLRDTPPQVGQDLAARVANVRGAFAVPAAQANRLRGRRVALIDDVMTTGATLAEAARTVLQAGALSVEAWVVTRTPRE